MGWVLSKFRKSKSTMEVLTKLESDIKGIVEFKASTAQTQKKVVGHLVTYSIVIYLLVAIFAYFKLFPAARTTQDQLVLLLPFLVAPLLIWGLRWLLTWWYHRKIFKNEKKLDLLKKEKIKILDEVMEKETYKVAKEILDKFGDKTHLQGSKPLPGMSAVFKPNSGAGGESQLRRRPIGDPGGPGLKVSMPGNSSVLTSASSKPGLSASPAGPAPPPSSRGQPLALAGGQQRQPPTLAGVGGRSMPGPPLPRPILPRERGYLDKFVEFLVGDGPANRYALICRQCESHNGMALREEFEYIAFRCCYCYYWNPARKQRPVAPRLVAGAPAAAPSSESSGSDVSAPASVPGSRRPSVSNTEPEEQEEKPLTEAASPVHAEEESLVESEMEVNNSPVSQEIKIKSEMVPKEVTPEQNNTERLPQSDNEIESNNAEEATSTTNNDDDPAIEAKSEKNYENVTDIDS